MAKRKKMCMKARHNLRLQAPNFLIQDLDPSCKAKMHESKVSMKPERRGKGPEGVSSSPSEPVLCPRPPGRLRTLNSHSPQAQPTLSLCSSITSRLVLAKLLCEHFKSCRLHSKGSKGSKGVFPFLSSPSDTSRVDSRMLRRASAC